MPILFIKEYSMIYCGRWYSVENKKKGKNHKKNPWWIPGDKTPTGKNASPTFVKKGHAPIALHVSPNETPPRVLFTISRDSGRCSSFSIPPPSTPPSLSLSSLLPRLYHRSPHVQILELLQLRFSLTISRFLRSNRRWFASRLRVDLRADTVENLRASHFFLGRCGCCTFVNPRWRNVAWFCCSPRFCGSLLLSTQALVTPIRFTSKPRAILFFNY